MTALLPAINGLDLAVATAAVTCGVLTVWTFRRRPVVAYGAGVAVFAVVELAYWSAVLIPLLALARSNA